MYTLLPDTGESSLPPPRPLVVKVVQDVVIRIVGYNQLWRIPLGHLGVAN